MICSQTYTQKGNRVIAIAYKPIKLSWLKAQKIERSQVESDLVFLALIVLQNKLKPQSKRDSFVFLTLLKSYIFFSYHRNVENRKYPFVDGDW